MEMTDFCPLSALFGFIFGFGWCLLIGSAQEIYDYFLERKKIKRLRRKALKICPVCGSYVGVGDTYCAECGCFVIDK